MLKSKPTKRKFYNKWLYKITLHIPGIHAFRYTGVTFCNQDETNSQLFRKIAPYISRSTERKLYENEELITRLSLSLQPIDAREWGMRMEGDRVDIYTNKKDLFDLLSETYGHLAIHRFEPHVDPKILDTGVYVVKKYPFDHYKFKVFLHPHKLNKDDVRKKQFLDWIDSQEERVKITDTTKNWFSRWNYNWDRRYMYVDDEKTLIMLKMKEPDAVGRIYKYVLTDK